MAMDRIQEEIDDFVKGDINEQVEDAVKRRYDEIVKRENKGYGYSLEEEKKIKAELRKEIRQEIIDNMQFKRRHQQERHLDDLQDQQRRYDTKKYQHTSSQMSERYWDQRKAMESEGRIYTDDINRIDPNAVVDRYADIANYFNIRDTETMKKIIESGNNGIIDGVAFRGLVESPEGKKILDMIIKENNGNINIGQLMSVAAQTLKSNAMSRVKTAEGYMDVAKNDLDVRASGVERKVEALTKTAVTSVERDQAYLDTLENTYSHGINSARNSEDEVKRRISLDEIEKATKNVRLSEINSNSQIIRRSQQTKDKSKDIEKE